MSVGYVGSHTAHLLADYDINAGYPGSTLANLPYNLAYGRTQPTNMWDGYLSSNYNSLQVAVNKSFSKGLLIKAAYTYSKTIDYTDDDGWASVGWNWAPVFQRNRAVAGFDRTHVLQIGWVYELPLGKGKTLVKSGVPAAILGGWQVNGVMAAYTGTPFTVGDSTALNAQSNTQTANQVNPVVARPGNVGPGTVLLRSHRLRFGGDHQHVRQQRTQHPAQSGRVEHGPDHQSRVRHQGAAQDAVQGRVLQPPEYVSLQRSGQHQRDGRDQLHEHPEFLRRAADPIRPALSVVT